MKANQSSVYGGIWRVHHSGQRVGHCHGWSVLLRRNLCGSVVLSYYYGLDEEELFDAGQKITQLRQSVVCQNMSTSNPGGKIRFYVPLMRETISAEVKKMIIRVTAINYPSNNQTGMTQPTR